MCSRRSSSSRLLDRLILCLPVASPLLELDCLEVAFTSIALQLVIFIEMLTYRLPVGSIIAAKLARVPVENGQERDRYRIVGAES